MAGGFDEGDIDGKTFRIPSYAKESTLRDLVNAMKSLARETAGSADEYRDSAGRIEDAFRDATSDSSRDIGERLGRVSSTFDFSLKRLGRDIHGGLAKMADNIREGRGLIGGLFKFGGLALTTSVAAFVSTIDEIRSALGDLNLVGLNLSAGWGEDLTQSTLTVLQSFQSLGLSMGEAAKIMTSNSFAMAANRKTVMTTIQAFKQLTNNGAALGLSVEENAKIISDEMEARSKMMFRNRVDGIREAAQVNTLIRAQMKYSKILGQNVDDLRKSAQGILQGSDSAVSLIALMGDAGDETMTALNVFTSGLLGSGFTEEYTRALVESAAGIAPLVNESTQDMFATMSAAGVNMMPLLDNLNRITRTGNLTANEANRQMESFRDAVANIDEQGLTTLRYMAAAGDSGAKQLLLMNASVRQAKKSAQDLAAVDKSLGGERGILESIRMYDAAVAQMGSTFSILKTKLMVSFMPIMTKLAEVIEAVVGDQRFQTAIANFADTVGKALLGITGSIKDVNVKEFLDTNMPKIVEGINATAKFFENIINMVKSLFPDPKEKEKEEKKASSPFEGAKKYLGDLYTRFTDFVTSTDLLSGLFKAAAAFGVALLVFKGVTSVLGSEKAQSTALNLGLLGGALVSIGVGIGKITESNPEKLMELVKGVGALTAIVGAAGLAIKAGGGVVAAGYAMAGAGVIGATIALVAGSVRAFPFEELTKMTEGLSKISEVKTGVFSSLASEIKVLAEAIMKLTSASVGGITDNITDFVTGDLKTPIGLLANDLQRLSNVAKSLPPAVRGMTNTPVAGTTVGTLPNPRGASTLPAPVAPLTPEQELLTRILTELKRSVTALNEIKTIEQNKLT